MTTHDATDEVDDILNLVTQDSARSILAAASDRPCTAEELAEQCDISLPTVYRHVTELQERGLLDEKLRIDESGDHVREFETTLESISFTFTDQGADAEIRFR
ncbi:ArsR/SmtB family transcription factor [Halobacterium zhouii]|uniref:ArsR/SmtB family transcription factor n=1 Tax=Halobacterium zhouii TaxID=2902624 RepID=UPI001E452A37|nr:helix-turn-helix domain-containing protein [Halobacterium zhouii]